MALLSSDLRASLVAALRANTTFASVMGNSTGTVHVEGGDQPDLFLKGAAGAAWCRSAGEEVLESYSASARTAFSFELRVGLVDTRGAASALGTAQMGLSNALADKGAALFTSYFTDTGSNRLGGSGEWRVADVAVVPLEALPDPDRPEIVAVVVCELWHKVPLT